jgi:hypothetical protein
LRLITDKIISSMFLVTEYYLFYLYSTFITNPTKLLIDRSPTNV